jgi:hypothetical protein
MNKQFWLAITLGSLTLGLAGQAQAKLYKWVDDSGEVHYGDKIPPKYSNQQHQELSARGIQMKAVERKKTQAERDAELAAQSEEQQRVAAKRKLQVDQSRKDQILLDTFTVERDLLIMRDDRLSSIDSTISLTTTYDSQIEKQIVKTQDRIDNLEKNKRDVPENLTKKVKNLTDQLEKNTAHIARLRKDKILLEKQFKDDLMRFRELKGLPPLPEEPAASEPAVEVEVEAAE